MAYEVRKINPLDLRESVAVGVSIPFSSTSVFNSTYTTKDALKSNLINYLLTDTNERYLNLDFGAGLNSLLFDQLTEDKQDTIEFKIRSGLNTWFPNVEVSNLSVSKNTDSNSVLIQFNYTVKNTNIEDQLIINIEQ